MEQGFQRIALVPLFAEYFPDICQTEAPWQRPDESVNNESRQIHFRDSGRKRDEGSNYRQQPAAEDDHLTTTLKPPVGKVQIVLRNKHESAIFFDKRAAPVDADPIRHKRSGHASDRTSHS